MRQKGIAPDGFLSPGLKIIGAKQGQLKESARKQIYALIPQDTTTWIETFMGGGSVTIGKGSHPIEIMNDLNPWVVNWYRCLQNDPAHLWRHLSAWLNNLTETSFFEARSELCREREAELDHLHFELAAAYYVVNKLANNGILRWNLKGDCNSTYCKTIKGRGLFTEEWLTALSRRVQNVHFYNLDYLDLLRDVVAKWCAPQSTFIYLDPPYYEVETKYYSSWGKWDHDKLAAALYALNNSGYRWLLSYNDCPSIRQLYARYDMTTLSTHWCCSNTPEGRGKKEELLIANYPLQKPVPQILFPTTVGA